MSWIVLIMLMSLLVSILFFFTKHPLSMGFNLLSQTVMISMMTGMLNYNFWYSFILFLIMVGGMLILFIYMTSVASNEKFNPSTPLFISMIIILFMMMMFIYFNQPKILSIEIFNQLTNFLNTKENWMLSLNKFFSYPHNLKLVMLMSYLFLALIAVVKITNIKYGPLRTKN